MLVDRVELDETEPSASEQLATVYEAVADFVVGPWWPETDKRKHYLIEDYALGEIVNFEVKADCVEWGYVPMSTFTSSGTGPHGYAHPASIYPAIVTPAPKPGADWVGTDETGYTSAQLKARIMSLGQGAEWWAMMGGEWLKDEDGGPLAFPSARMAREQVEHRRAKEQG